MRKKKLNFEELIKTDNRFLVIENCVGAEKLCKHFKDVGIDFCWIGYYKNEDGSCRIRPDGANSIIYATKDTYKMSFKMMKMMVNLEGKVHYYPEQI